MADGNLTATLKRLRRRMLVIDGTSALGWGLFCAVAVLLAGAWLDLVLELSAALRLAVLIAAGAAIGVLSGALLWKAFGRAVPQMLARRLDEVAGTGGQILSAVDLARPELALAWSSRPRLSSGLAAMAVEEGSKLAATVPRRRAVPARPVGRSFGALAGLLGLTGLLVLLMPSLAQTEWLRLTQPFSDHPPYSRIKLDVQPKGAEVVYGSGLEIHVSTEGPPVETVELVLLERDGDGASSLDSRPSRKADSGSREVLPMFRETDGRWRAAVADIRVPLEYYVRAGRARSRRYPVDVITVPRIEEVRVRITPAAYAGLPDYEGKLPPGGLAGLPGTRVTVWARSNRPLSGGRMEFVSGEKATSTGSPAADGSRAAGETADIPMEPVDGDAREVTGRFTIGADGRLDLRVVDVQGQESTDVFSAPVIRLLDERPFVRLLQPRAVSFATPTAVIPVVVAAEDDYGISRLQLFRSLNDSRALPVDLPVADPPPRRARAETRLPLAAYGLSPGDEIKLFARVEDNDFAGGTGVDADNPAGKGAESSIAVLRIISQEDYQRLQRARDGMQMLMSKYQQARRRMEGLAEEIESLRKKAEKEPADSKPGQQLRQRLQQLQNRLQQEQDALRKLQQAELPYDLDKQLSKYLEQQADSLERLIKRTEALEQNMDLTNRELQQELQQMLDRLGEQRERLDNEVITPLQELAAVLPLAQDESRFVQIYRRQRDLADRLSSLKGRDAHDDPALKSRMRDLEEEQRQIRADLERLLEDIEEHIIGLPDDERFDELRKTAAEFVAAVRSSGASEAMREAKAGLAEFSGTRGHAGAKKAADILEQFLKKCRGMGANGAAGACLRFQPGIGEGLGRSLQTTLQQLLRDAGMMPGTGFGAGQGAGGGFSARRSTLQNVGLYGGLPQLADQSQQQDGTTGETGAGDVRNLGSGRTTIGRGTGFEAGAARQASGTGEAVVPLKYRRKVGRYFQRIADETGGR